MVVLLACAIALAAGQRNRNNNNRNNRNRGNNNNRGNNRGNNRANNRNPVVGSGRATPANARDSSGNEVYPGCNGTVCLPLADLCSRRKQKRK